MKEEDKCSKCYYYLEHRRDGYCLIYDKETLPVQVCEMYKSIIGER